jgi:hypothetical protein
MVGGAGRNFEKQKALSGDAQGFGKEVTVLVSLCSHAPPP